MIVLRANPGTGLGNQMFHLAALDRLCNGRRLGLFLCTIDFKRLFDWRRRGVMIVTRPAGSVTRAARWLARMGLVAYHTEGQIQSALGPVPSGELVAQNRSFSPVTFIEESYLQSDRWMRADFPRMLAFRPETIGAVHAFGAENNIDWTTSIFVHVRRGDYVRFNVFDQGTAALPPEYYRDGIRRLQSQMNVSNVIFVTDDAAYVSREFADVPQKVVVSRNEIFDLCLISKCASGVMSASTFSWWGAMLGSQRVAPVAPRHWLGWRCGIDYPHAIISRRFDLAAVPALAAGK